ncbi:MAG: DUF3108 domain-containing protein [Candidatus Bathyarchaeota archaeon]|nr:DUF3108 domain-containing protein [Candidatus Bathyarchaeota archaeon]
MINQQEPSLPPLAAPSSPEPAAGKPRRKMYFAVAAIALIAVIVAAALMVPQIAGASMQLSLSYTVGERMVYQNTNQVTNQAANASLTLPGMSSSQSYNSTLRLDILEDKGEYYVVDEKITTEADLSRNIELPLITLNISKAGYYNNFMAPGGPLIFYNATDPAILAYLAQSTVRAGDVWTIPVNTGNATLGLTGEVTLKFVGFEEITVPAGTYTVMHIEVSSGTLTLHSDNSLISGVDGMTLRLSGNTYIEQSSCRLIKADLTQQSSLVSSGVERSSTVTTEKTLIEHTHP